MSCTSAAVGLVDVGQTESTRPSLAKNVHWPSAEKAGTKSLNVEPRGEQGTTDVIDLDRDRRCDLLGGLIREYRLAA
jgi:hypothetical protein